MNGGLTERAEPLQGSERRAVTAHVNFNGITLAAELGVTSGAGMEGEAQLGAAAVVRVRQDGGLGPVFSPSN